MSVDFSKLADTSHLSDEDIAKESDSLVSDILREMVTADPARFRETKAAMLAQMIISHLVDHIDTLGKEMTGGFGVASDDATFSDYEIIAAVSGALYALAKIRDGGTAEDRDAVNSSIAVGAMSIAPYVAKQIMRINKKDNI